MTFNPSINKLLYFAACRQLKQNSYFMPLTVLHEGTIVDCFVFFILIWM